MARLPTTIQQLMKELPPELEYVDINDAFDVIIGYKNGSSRVILNQPDTQAKVGQRQFFQRANWLNSDLLYCITDEPDNETKLAIYNKKDGKEVYAKTDVDRDYQKIGQGLFQYREDIMGGLSVEHFDTKALNWDGVNTPDVGTAYELNGKIHYLSYDYEKEELKRMTSNGVVTEVIPMDATDDVSFDTLGGIYTETMPDGSEKQRFIAFDPTAPIHKMDVTNCGKYFSQNGRIFPQHGHISHTKHGAFWLEDNKLQHAPAMTITQQPIEF